MVLTRESLRKKVLVKKKKLKLTNQIYLFISIWNFITIHILWPCLTQSKHRTLATLLTLWTDSLSDLSLVRISCFQMVYEIVVLKNYTSFIMKHLDQGPVQMFSVDFTKFSRTPFLQNASGRLHFPRLDKLHKILLHRYTEYQRWWNIHNC